MNDLSLLRTRGVPQNPQPAPEYFSRREPEEVPLSHYWDIIVKRRNIVLAISLAIFLAGSYFALSATKLYKASATIKIEPQNPKVTGINELQPLDWSAAEYDYHQTQFALLASRPLAARVITELGLEANKTFTDAEVVSPNAVDHVKAWISRALGFVSYHLAPLVKTKSDSDAKGSNPADNSSSDAKLEPELSLSPGLISRYLGFIRIEPVKKTRLVRVHFTTPNAALSQTLANAHVENFMRLSLEGRFSLTREARGFLEEKKNELRRRLEKAETALNNFRRSHGVVSIEKGENIVVDRLVDFNKQLTAARAQRIEAESLYRTVESRNNQEIAEVMKQGLVQNLKGNVAALEAEKARMATVFRPDHPRIQELNQQIAAARQAFDEEIAQAVRAIRSAYSAALARERGLEAEADKQQRDALRLRELGVDYTLLQEEVNANRSLYESVLKRLSETNVASDLALSNMQIAERAAMPRGSSGPDVGMYLLASMLSGLFLGIGAAFLREFADSAIGTPDKVWRSVGLGTLGVVPEFKGGGMSAGRLIERVYSRQKEASQVLPPPHSATKELILNHNPRSILTESYRTIRTSLLLSQAEKPPRVILLTSPSPGEGKTVTSLNLAIALAEDGHSVVLVDADMRKGCCHERLGLRRNGGLSNLLSSGLLLRDALQQTSVERLDFLSRGIPPPNPTELLGSRKMKEVLTELRQRYDFIIIDSPPVIAISDASILSVIAEGVLLVLNAQVTSIPYAQKAVERLDFVRAHLLGVILNAVNIDDPHYSYYQSYNSYYRTSTEDGGIDINGHARKEREKSRGIDQRLASTDYEIHVGRLKNVNGNGGPNSKSPRQSFEPAVEEPFVEADQPLRGSPSKQTQAAVPLTTGCTLNRVIEALTDAVGPIAPIIVHEHVAALGESRYGFPEHRIDELIRSLELSITEGELQLFSKNLVGKDSVS